jgi:hypothetical protein
MFNFSQLPFSTGLVLFFNGRTDEIILHTKTSESNTLGVIQTNNIVLEIKRNNPIIL